MSEKLVFQTLHPFKPSSTVYNKNIRYNAIDSRAGLLASIANNDVNFYNISTYEIASNKSAELKDKLVQVDPILTIKCDSNASWLEFNCDGSLLLVAMASDTDTLLSIRLVNVEETLKENKESIYCEYKPNTESQLVDLRWHPNEKESFLMILNETVSLCCVKENRIDIINQKSNAFCVSWSPKGKQFSVVMKNDNSDGLVVNQYDNLMNEKRSSPIRDVNYVFKVQVNLVPLELCWYSTFNFIIGFRGNTPDVEQSKIYTCNFGIKTQTVKDLSEVKSSSSCISKVMPRARLYFIHIIEWNIIALLNNSAEDLHFYKYDKDNNLEYLHSFCLPVDGNAIGFSCDFTSNQVLSEKWLSPYDGEKKSRFPILLFKLSNSECSGIYLIQSLKTVEKDVTKMKILNDSSYDSPNLDSCNNLSDNTGNKASLCASNWETGSDIPDNVSNVSRAAPIIEPSKSESNFKSDLPNQSKSIENQSGDNIVTSKPTEIQTTTNIFNVLQTPNQSNINICSTKDLFGTKSSENTNIFGTKNTENQPSTNLFGNKSQPIQNQKLNIFGSPNTENQSGMNLFGNKSSENQPVANQKQNIFGTPNTEIKSGTNLFGNKSSENQPVANQKQNIFGTPNTEIQSGTNLFGNKSSDSQSIVNQKPNIFGTQKTENQSGTGIFGAESQSKSGVNLFTTKISENQASSNLFGSKTTESQSNKNIFGNQTDSNSLNSNLFGGSKSDGKFDSHNFTNRTKFNLFNIPKDKPNTQVESKVTEKTENLSISSSHIKTKKSEIGGKSPKEKSGSTKIEKEESITKSNSQKQASGDHENASIFFPKSGMESKKDTNNDRTIVKSTKTNVNKDKVDIADHILPDALRTLEEGINEIKISTYGLIKKSRDFFNSNKMKVEIPQMIKDVDQYYVDINKLNLHNDETISNCGALFQDIDITSEFTSRFKATILASKMKNKHFPTLPNPLLKTKSININEQYLKVNSCLKDLEEILDDYENKRQCKENKDNKSFQVNNIFEILKSNSKEISLERSKVDLLKEHLKDIKEEPIDFNNPKASYLKMQSVPAEMERRLHHLMCRRTVKVLPCQFLEIKPNIPVNQDNKTKISNRKTQETVKKDTKLITPESQKAPINIIPKNAYKSPINKELPNPIESGHPNITVSSSKTPSSYQFNLSSNASKVSMPTAVSHPLSSKSSVSPFCFSTSKEPENNLLKNFDNKPLTSFTNIKTETLVTKATDTVVTQGKNVSTPILLTGDDKIKLPKSNDSFSNQPIFQTSTPSTKSPGGFFALPTSNSNSSVVGSSLEKSNKTNIIPTLFKPQISKPNEIPTSCTTAPSSEQIKFVSTNNTVTSGLFSIGFTSTNQGSGGILSSPVTVSNVTCQSTSSNQGLFGKSIVTSSSTSGTISTTKPNLGLLGHTTTKSQPGLFSSPTSTSSVVTTSQSTNLFTTPSTNKSTELFGTSTATSQTGKGLFSTSPLNVTSSQSTNLFPSATKSNESLCVNATVTTIQTGGGLFGSTTTSSLSTVPLSNGLFGVSSNTSGGLFGIPINVTSSQSSGLFGSPVASKPSTSLSSSSSPTTTTNVSQSSGLFGTNKSSGGLFGNSPITTNTSQSTGLFGQILFSQPTGGLFGKSPLSTNTTQSSGLFEQTQSGKPSGGLFGNSPGSTSTTQSSGLFGQNQSSKPSGGLFGNSPGSTSTTQSSGLFGQTQSSKPSGGLFGNSPGSTSTTQSSGLFGQTQSSKPSGGLFGNSPASTTTTQSTGLFGAATSSQSTGLFGNTVSQPQTGGGFFSSTNTTNQSSGLFGSPKPNNSQSTGGLFGQSVSTPTQSTGLFGTPKPPATGNLFGGSAPKSTGSGLFGNNAQTSNSSLFSSSNSNSQSTNLFGSANTPANNLFGAKNNTDSQMTTMDSSGLSFGSCSLGGTAGNQTSNKSTNIFASVNTNDSAAKSNNLFAPNNQSGNLFNTTKQNSLFANNTTSPGIQQSSSLFGSRPVFGNTNENIAQQSSVQTGGLFSNTIFGNSNDNSSHMSFGDVATNNENRPGFGANSNGSLFPTTSPSFTQRRM